MSNGTHRDDGSRWELPTTPLLRAKLRRSRLPEHHVRRPRLLQLLDQEVGAPITLIVAPAGAGKTVLVSSWTAESTVPTAWLSLDEADNDGPQLWSGIISALEALRPRCGEAALGLLRRRCPSPAIVGQLLDDLESGEASPGVLVVDDLHVVEDDDAAASLALFLQHLPAWLHVVLLSRRDPNLPIDRLRARGHLVAIHFGELKFSHDEAREMLTRLVPTLPDDQLDATAAHAAGWAAGLQLAALATRATRPSRPSRLPAPPATSWSRTTSGVRPWPARNPSWSSSSRASPWPVASTRAWPGRSPAGRTPTASSPAPRHAACSSPA